jgi:transposase-like protein
METDNTQLPKFEEVKYSKGSQNLVIWTCPFCTKKHIKKYRLCIDKKACQDCYQDYLKSTREYEVLPFEQVKDSYSKGSHKKVSWVCPLCSKTFLKTFKQALKTTYCKPCNTTKQNKEMIRKGKRMDSTERLILLNLKPLLVGLEIQCGKVDYRIVKNVINL